MSDENEELKPDEGEQAEQADHDESDEPEVIPDSEREIEEEE